MERSIFTDFVGNSLRTRAMEYFVTWKNVKIRHQDLLDGDVGTRVQVAKEVVFLLNEKFIVKKDNGYTLNNRNKAAKSFCDLFKAVIKQELPKLEKKLKKR